MTDLLHSLIERLEPHPVPEWVERVCADFGVTESGLPRYRVIWNPDRRRAMNILNPETGQFVQKFLHKYPRLGERWIVEVLVPWERYGPWHEEAFGPKPADGEYCHSHTIQERLCDMMHYPACAETEYLSLDDFGADNLRLLLYAIERSRALQAWQLNNYDQEMIEREEREFHDQFENVYDDTLGEIRQLEKLQDQSGLVTSLDKLPDPIERERQRKAKRQGKTLIH